MNNKNLTFIKIFISVVCLTVVIYSCKTYYFRNQYEDFNALIHSSDVITKNSFLKAHLKNGNVSILRNNWNFDSTQTYIHGSGTTYDYNRHKIFEGQMNLLIDSVSIFETNKNPTKRIQAITIVAALDLALAIPCIIIPKACFGSCPTFYIDGLEQSGLAQAEGFSHAIAPSMEYGDIDALGSIHPESRDLIVHIKNEALETHCLNQVQLLAVSVLPNKKIYHTNEDEFYRGSMPIPPILAIGYEGNITSLVSKEDYEERYSPADEKNLNTKEEIYLEFMPGQILAEPGLVLHFRQTLMTTYFIYSALGYMGDQIGEIFADIEKGSLQKNKIEEGIYKELGRIEVYLFDEMKSKYIHQGGLYETGPIAINKQLIKLSRISAASTFKIKLILNKGLWRIDYAGLTNLEEKIEPLRLNATNVLINNMEALKAKETLADAENHFVNLPGQEITMKFNLPRQNTTYELFLFSKGYYLEWMRSHWIKDKNLFKLYQMINQPVQFLKTQTSDYKKYESEMETIFWNSKIGINSIQYENY